MATCFRLEAFGRPLAPASCEPATPQGSEVVLRAGRAHAIPITPYPLARANDVLAALKAGAVTGRAVLNP